MKLKHSKVAHPGEVLQQLLKKHGITIYRLSIASGVRPSNLDRLTRGQSGITANLALRFAVVFRTTPEFWLELQNKYDLQSAKATYGDVLSSIEPLIEK